MFSSFLCFLFVSVCERGSPHSKCCQFICTTAAHPLTKLQQYKYPNSLQFRFARSFSLHVWYYIKAYFATCPTTLFGFCLTVILLCLRTTTHPLPVCQPSSYLTSAQLSLRTLFYWKETLTLCLPQRIKHL